jgi:hypothetical protein
VCALQQQWAPGSLWMASGALGGASKACGSVDRSVLSGSGGDPAVEVKIYLVSSAEDDPFRFEQRALEVNTVPTFSVADLPLSVHDPVPRHIGRAVGHRLTHPSRSRCRELPLRDSLWAPDDSSNESVGCHVAARDLPNDLPDMLKESVPLRQGAEGSAPGVPHRIGVSCRERDINSRLLRSA